jgi:hypothetical protein
VRAAVESDLSTTAKRVVRKADETGWVTVGVVSTFVGDGRGAVSSMLSLRGRRAGGKGGSREARSPGRFVVTFVDGAFDAAWFWTREHRTLVKGYRREDRWVIVDSSLKMPFWGGKVQQYQAHLVHDPELDEVVTWRSEQPTRERLGSLSELVGVAGGKNPRPGLLDLETTQE